MNVSIRPARATDIAAIFTIRTSVKENHLSLVQLAEMGITPEQILDMLVTPPCIWVADIDSTTVGFAIISQDEGSLFALFVLPEYQGTGIGKCLMDHAEAALFEHHSVIWLETDSLSQAAQFYQHRGWSVMADLPGSDKRYEKQRQAVGQP
ncbi:GNAT family N-acetyltransferase [Citrobacter sp. JGM124]|uniref:GNAT family N-acetyltransferase n=1 Tax=Citrobacter sp. JGM124 TaxID=2799789 RepID=UPI001BAC019A|nr:GNAT family N-acetyltransferase [Citrobacter sp. JGM124]MBS0847371.1 GNAT family N-acetyltransferase [Citrobacter sp. JGM124]